MPPEQLALVLQALLVVANRPLREEQLRSLLEPELVLTLADIQQGLCVLNSLLLSSALELVQVASGYRLQIRGAYAVYVGRLQEERLPRFSRALMETLALIAYRQPITRSEIEEIRGVSVSSQIMRTLQEREWIRMAGHREVPGRPALWVTTREFLDALGVQKLSDLPPLADVEALGAQVLGDMTQEHGQESGDIRQNQ